MFQLFLPYICSFRWPSRITRQPTHACFPWSPPFSFCRRLATAFYSRRTRTCSIIPKKLGVSLAVSASWAIRWTSSNIRERSSSRSVHRVKAWLIRGRSRSSCRWVWTICISLVHHLLLLESLLPLLLVATLIGIACV